MKRLVSVFAVICLSAALASAQSLAEVAKKEKERRKKADAQGKQSFTETDLRGGPRLPASAAKPGGAPAGTSEEAAAPEQDPTKTESYWRDRVAAVNKKIQELEAKLKSPELNSDARGATRRQTAERDLAQARSEKQAMADEARRKGIPPGWLR
jgi:type II secretory pathway pseudopilin PulG